MKLINDFDVCGKRVLVRVDFNVPMDDNFNITDDFRIKQALPTLLHLIHNKASIIIVSHLGRPKGKPNPQFSLNPAAKHLQEILGIKVKFVDNCIGEEVKKLSSEIKQSEILFLENLRFYKEEEENDKAFAKQLADLCDIYVNDAFGLAHRAHASIAAITEFAKASCAGFLLYEECDYLTKAMQNPKRPLAAIIGGAKVSSKIAALKNMLSYVDKIIIGGAVANTFLKALGYEMANSKVDLESIENAKSIMKIAAEKNIRLYLPEDLVVAEKASADTHIETVKVNEIPQGFMALDVGIKSLEVFRKALQDAQTIIWNGTLGLFEIHPFAFGTQTIAEIITDSSAFTLIGGGDTGSALYKIGLHKKVSYISTGGGAFLSFLAGKTMPAIEALNKAE